MSYHLTYHHHQLKDIIHLVNKVVVVKATARAGSADLQYGLLRMSEVLAEILKVPPVMRVFRNVEDAEEWIIYISQQPH